MVTYRIVVRTADSRERFQGSPAVSRAMESKRDSKKAYADAMAVLYRELARHVPSEEGKATAYVERSDRFGPQLLVRYSGHPTQRDMYSGKALRGLWRSEDGTHEILAQ